MAEHLERRFTDSPGPRTRVTLDVAEVSLPTLLQGIDAVRCWLIDEGDGVYSFHASQSMGDLREQGDKPAGDILVELLNRFADELDKTDVPERLRRCWSAMVDEYIAKTARPREPDSASTRKQQRGD